MKKILICRIGAFGDICMTLPVVHSLSSQFEVHWLIRRGHDAILRLFPEVKCHPVVFDSKGSDIPPGLISEIAAAKYDALLDFSNWTVVGTLANRLKSIPLRATAYDTTRPLALHRIQNALTWREPFNKVVRINGAVHRVFKWQQLVKSALGCDLVIQWPLPPVKLPEEALRVFVNPHASKPSKRWSIDNFVAVLSQLGGRKPTHCLVNEGNTREAEAAAELGLGLRGAGLEVTPVPFDPSFNSLREALGEVHFALGPDSGPTHFASLMGVPSVIIYGPYSPTEVAPLWRTVAVTPPGGQGTIRDVTPPMVLDGIGKLFSLIFDRLDLGVRL